MAGVLSQANATLTKVSAAPVLSDSFTDSFSGSGDGPEELVSKWEGQRGAWVTAINERLESSSDGRDELEEKRLICPTVCQIEIGDIVEVTYQGEEQIWKVAGVSLHGQGVELGAGQSYELQIEVS
jgi:hypothetical protein